MICLDLDNTLIAYDRLFYALALANGWLGQGVLPRKTAIRDHVRSRHGDVAWQRLQVAAYGLEIHRADVFDGALRFLRRCSQLKRSVVVVSHKTQYARIAPECPNLRKTALAFMDRRGFFEDDTLLDRSRVFFESSRSAKIARINRLGCTHLVDDLPEVLTNPDLPPGIKRILFTPEGALPPEGVAACRSWDEVAVHVLGA